MKKLLVPIMVLLPALAWAQGEPKAVLRDVNTAEMWPANCLAGTRIEDKNAPGGFASSNNLPHPLGKMKVTGREVYLRANPDQLLPLSKQYKGMTVFLVNPTAEVKPFSASDSRLTIVQEALDTQGKWKPIEFLYSSFCGNSYHQVFLGAREYWSFTVPRYTGTYKTKLRFRLSEDKVNLLSNEFEGSINPGQFDAPKEPYMTVLPPLPDQLVATRP